MIVLMLSVVLLTLQGATAYSFRDLVNTDNWTSCEEFLSNSTFDVDEILDVPLRIFYYWTIRDDGDEKIVLTFRKSSIELARRFQSVFEKKMIIPVKWMKAELYMESNSDVAALLIPTNKTGLYIIVQAVVPQEVINETTTMALKIVDRYLVSMNCETRFAYALAPINSMPTREEIPKALQVINFRGELASSYLGFENFTSSSRRRT